MIIVIINEAQEDSFWPRKECGWDWAENTDCNHISRGMHRLLVVQDTADRKQQHIIQKCCIVLDAATSIDAAATSDVTGCPSLMAGVGVPTFKTRADLGNVMQSEGFTVGVELGGQNRESSWNSWGELLVFCLLLSPSVTRLQQIPPQYYS